MKGDSPRVLLVEDDAISREVLALAISGVPAEVVAAGSLAEARAAISREVFPAWMVDAHLPDGAGTDLLPLRPAQTIALAHTASTERPVLEALVAAGFADVLVKPLAAGDVQAALRRAFAGALAPAAIVGEGVVPPVWDDAAALRALAGHAGNVAGLRGLFVRELEPTLARVRRAFEGGDASALHAELHRLKASCGFVGAARLATAVERVSADGRDARAHQALHDAARDTLATDYPAPPPS